MLQKISIFQGVSLLFLSIVLGDMLIPGGTVIPDPRVVQNKDGSFLMKYLAPLIKA